MAPRLREFTLADYGEVRELWEKSGLGIRPGDSRAEVKLKIERDSDLFLVAEDGGRIVGTAMGAWDGRRGWIYHLGVHPGRQRSGIATALVGEVERRMRAKGVVKVNANVFKTNSRSIAFFEKMGYRADRSILFYGKYLRANRRASMR